MIPGRASPSLALAAYAEAWIAGAKVIVFGSAQSPLAERLVERGARLVQVCDDDPVRVAEATARRSSTQVSYALLERAGATGRDGAFDVGIVEDLSAAGDDPASLLKPLARCVSRRGLALVASPNPEVSRHLIAPRGEGAALGYYELYDAVGTHFEEVRMLGQTAFVGYAVADFAAADDGDVRLDTTFLPRGAEEPEFFVALASELPVEAESFAVIQLPFEDLDESSAKRTAASDAGLRAAAKIAELEAALSQLSVKRTREAQADGERREARERVRALEEELKKREEWLSSLEARAATADRRADEAQAELERENAAASDRERALSRRLEQAGQERDRAEKKLERLAKSQADLEAQLEQAQSSRTSRERKLETQLGQAQSSTSELRRKLDESDAAKRALEDAVSALRTELEAQRESKEIDSRARRERDGRAKRESDERRAQLEATVERLTSELEQMRAKLDHDEKRAQLEATVKRLTSELEQSRAAVGELEPKLQREREAGRAEADSEIAELEQLLRERAREVNRLEGELHETERLGRQLILQVQELSQSSGGRADEESLSDLARQNAELAADLEATRWSLAALQGGAPMAESGVGSAGSNPAASD